MPKTTPATPYHYGVIARAITELDTAKSPLSLNDLADRMGMSPAHFQRTFTAWVGVSPKRYQQYLSLDLAKRLLSHNFSTLETSLSTGLSGTSRLYDLFVRWEAMSPGTYARGGEGLTIRYGWFDSPFGPSLVMGTDVGICGIALTAQTDEDTAMADLTARWPKANYEKDEEALAPWVRAAYEQSGDVKLHLMGSGMQIKVWEALLSIPSGQVSTYSELAKAVGNPRAVRAIGTCVGRNPISWIIPCHRVLRKSGALGGYHWGLPIKRALLAYEAARSDVL